VIVRLGVVIAIPFAMLADRRGRRQMIIVTAWVAPVWCALGAIAPNFWVLVGTQTIGRPVGLALALLIGVVAAEEMPRSSRAYALSVLALAGGLGAGVAVAALRLADLGRDGWRLVYVLSLIWLLPAYHLTRHLPETHRFEHRHVGAQPLDRRRFVTISIVAITANLFVAPASFFQNRYLDDVRGYTGGGIALFTLSTATPASLGLIVGGRIADIVGRRAVLAVCMPVSTLLVVGSFSYGGSTMWLLALFGGLLAGAAYPAFTVYRTELFPTGNRGRANGYITALSLAGSSVGLIAVGGLVDHGWTYGKAMLLVGLGQLIAAVIAFVAYPETAHLELEQINPQDA
jgi:MFS family permease